MSGFQGIEKIDPDEIARGIAPGVAVREALHRRRAALRAGRAHLIETALAVSAVFGIWRLRGRQAIGSSCTSYPSDRPT